MPMADTHQHDHAPPTRRGRGLPELVRWWLLADRDKARTNHERRAIDRQAVGQLDGDTPSAKSLIEAWRRVQPIEPQDQSVVESISLLTRLIHIAAIVIGVVLGISLAAGLFAYDGKAPVNLVWAIVVFVGGGVATVLITAVGVGIRLLGGPRQPTNFAWAHWLVGPIRLLVTWPMSADHRKRVLDAWSMLIRRSDRRLATWWLLRVTQLFALAVYAAATIWFALAVITTDLAFGWAVTADVSPRQVQQITDGLSLPWAWAWPLAVPSEQLIVASQVFRGQPFDAGALRGWWPFMLMCMLVYGLGPRLVFWLASHWQVQRRIKRLLDHDPQAAIICHRLRQHRFGHVRDGQGDGNSPLATNEHVARAPATDPGSDGALVLAWAGAESSRDAQPFARSAGDAGIITVGMDERSDDEHAPQSLTDRLEKAQRDTQVVVLVRGWDVPTGDVLDWLGAVRRAVGDERTIIVQPVVQDKAGQLVCRDRAMLDAWEHRLASIKDQRLVFAQPMHPPGDASEDTPSESEGPS